MYEIDYVSNKNLNKIENAPVFGRLLQNSEDSGVTDSNGISPSSDSGIITPNNSTDSSILPDPSSNDSSTGINTYAKSTNTILINGTGVAGIGVTILFLIPVLIGCFAMMGIFVNTKFIDQPIKIKITE